MPAGTPATKLSAATLDRVPRSVARPAYAVDTLGIGIVHLGIGAFHRAHQAMYTDDALAQVPGTWGICGVSLRSPDVRDRMMPQDGLYTAIEKSPAGVRRRIVGSVRELLFLPDAREQVRERLSARDTRIISPAIRISSTTCRIPRRLAACRACWLPRWMSAAAARTPRR